MLQGNQMVLIPVQTSSFSKPFLHVVISTKPIKIITIEENERRHVNSQELHIFLHELPGSKDDFRHKQSKYPECL